MNNLEYYTDRIPSQYQGAARFRALLDLLLTPLFDLGACASAVTAAFDIDNAVGAQLDILGIILGADRELAFLPSGSIATASIASTSSSLTSAGPNGPSAGANVAAGGSAASWANPGNVTADDGSFATATLPVSGGATSAGPRAATSVASGGWANATRIETNDGSYATYVVGANSNTGSLSASGFGFSIPTGATILGIAAVVIHGDIGGGGSLKDNNIQLLKAGTAAGSNHAKGLNWGSGPETANYGSSVDLWGASWSSSDINNSGFGIQVSARNYDIEGNTAGLDYISITVYYSTAPVEQYSDQLKATGFGFALGSSDTVSGILVEVKGLQSVSVGMTVRVQLLKAGTLVGTLKTSALPASNGFFSLGGTADLWGATWAYSDINAANFGIEIQAVSASGALVTFSVDYARVTVYLVAASAYADGDILTVIQSSASGGLVLYSVVGGVPALSIYTGGLGYHTAPGLSVSGGSGTGMTVDITVDSPSATLDDAHYRVLLKAKILRNQWDGQIESLWAPWQELFPGGSIFITDNQNMTATVFTVGEFDALAQQMITNGMIVPRPEGVQYNYAFPALPVFGFGDENPTLVAGFGIGNWS